MMRRQTRQNFFRSGLVVSLVYAVFGLTLNSYGGDGVLKSSNVSGQFYEADPNRLAQQVNHMIDQVATESWDKSIPVIIVPHAGHVYSGGVAAHAFKAVSQQKISTVVLLGPTHYHQFNNVAIWPDGSFQTPLGLIDVDEDFTRSLMVATDRVKFLPHVFERDHVLEVEMPFIQKIFPDARIVPMIMSRSANMQTLKDLAAAVDQVVGDRDDVLFVISSDLSHFHPEGKAHSIDRRGLDAVTAMDIDQLWDDHHAGLMEIDGFKEVITALLYAKRRGLDTVEELKYATSGDVSGDRQRVVGYAALIMYKK